MPPSSEITPRSATGASLMKRSDSCSGAAPARAYAHAGAQQAGHVLAGGRGDGNGGIHVRHPTPAPPPPRRGRKPFELALQRDAFGHTGFYAELDLVALAQIRQQPHHGDPAYAQALSRSRFASSPRREKYIQATRRRMRLLRWLGPAPASGASSSAAAACGCAAALPSAGFSRVWVRALILGEVTDLAVLGAKSGFSPSRPAVMLT